MPQILVVDDDPDVLEVLRDRLEMMGFMVRTAENGQDALAIMETSEPDVILLDIEMPVMDGIHALQYIRARHPQLPVFMLSATGNTRRFEEAIAKGATAYFTKPIDAAAFKDAMSVFFTH